MFAVLAATRFVHFAAACILFGLAAFPFYAYPQDEACPRFDRAILWSAVLGLASAVAVLLAMSASMGGQPAAMADPSILWAVVSDTAFGRVWLVRIVLASVLLAVRLRRAPLRDGSLLWLSAALLASVALTGHSALPGGVPGRLHQLADAAHLLAAGWWIGGLFALAVAARRLGPGAHQVLERFSGVGYGAVAVIVLTGLFKSALLLASPAAMLGAAYGWTLLAKLALFAGMGALALANHFWVTPGLRRQADEALWLGRLHRQVWAEFALGLAVLAVVGALGALAPPVSA